MFCLYVILTISYLRAQTIETSSLPTDFSLFKQIEIFLILTVWLYINCKYFPYYTRELLECLLGISPPGRNPCGGNNFMRNLLFCQDCYRKWHFVENWKTGDATRSCLLKYRHLFYRTFQPLLPPFNTCTVVETKVIFKIVIITITTIYLKTIDIRAISEKRNRLRLAWSDMIIIEQCYLFRRGFTKEIAKIKLIQRDLKQADVISFRMEGRTQKQG